MADADQTHQTPVLSGYNTSRTPQSNDQRYTQLFCCRRHRRRCFVTAVDR